MKAVTKIFAGAAAVAVAAGGLAAPAAAQYYPGHPAPGYGYGYGNQGGLGAVIDAILGGNRYAHGVDQRALVERCIATVTNRLERQYAGYRAPYGAPYGYGNHRQYGQYDQYGQYGQYGQAGQYGQYGQYRQAGPQARVLGITNVDRRSHGLRVRGVATAGMHAAAPYGAPYGNAYGYRQHQQAGELTFRCDVDYRGRVSNIDVNRNRNLAYGQYGYPYGR